MMSASGFDILDALRLALGLGFLGAAAVMDIKTRTVPNRLWFLMFFVGVMVLEVGYIWDSAPQVLMLTPISAMIIFFIIFTEGELAEDALSPAGNAALSLGLLVVAVAIIVYQGWALEYSIEWIRSLHMPIMMAVAYGFYVLRLLHGGADAKALMGLTVLAPFYPSLGPLPLISNLDAMMTAFPFAFVILLDSALASLFVPLGYAVYNSTRGDIDKRMFFGYRMALKDVPKKFVWLMERVEDGEIVTVLFPSRGRGKKEELKDIKKLKEAGRKKSWVSPKIPFMVPMFAGYLIAFTIGNLIVGLIDMIVVG
jgi:Flp pilus assembly protein protease CpaA